MAAEEALSKFRGADEIDQVFLKPEDNGEDDSSSDDSGDAADES